MAGVHAMMIVGSGSGSGGGGGATANDCGDITVNALYLKPNGVTIAAIPYAACGKWHTFMGKDYYIAVDYVDLVSVVSVYKGLTGDGEVLADLTRDGQTKAIPLNQVVTTFVDKFKAGGYYTALFSDANTFNQSIGSWDTSNVTTMSDMFNACRAFNQDISGWNTGNVTTTNSMFQGCAAFNQDISGWNVSNVTDMGDMFDNCYAFNQDISGWNVSNVTYMGYMFRNCYAFNQDISTWCVSKIPSKPGYFDSSANASWTTAMKPKWGAPC